MPKPSEKPVEEGQVACSACLKEIPVSEAHSDEAEDYVRYFCGLECYDHWRKQATKEGERG